MRKVMVLFFVLFLSFVSASVNVHNYSVDSYYYPFDLIRGEVNLTISGEDFFSEVSSNSGDKMLLSDFLILNGADFECLPPDCSNNYDVAGGSDDEIIGVNFGEFAYGGFVLYGDDVVVTGIDFDIESDFGESSNRPIAINFFEGESWEFSDFSNSYSSKDWGCYNVDDNSVGPPIRKSSYCEMISISDTDSLFIGAYVDDGDSVDLKMSVYPEQGGVVLGSCLFNPGSGEGCRIGAGLDDIFEEGNYQVCVSSPSPSVVTNYLLYRESVGKNCGFVYSNGPWNSVEDYAIFAREAKFADASHFDKSDLDFSDLVVAANELIENRYEGDCSDGCILPFEVFGVFQDLRIFNIDVDYFDGSRDVLSHEVSSLEILPAVVDFSGVLDLEVLGFDIFESMKYSISIGDEVILVEDLVVLPSPIVSSVFPLNPPAGVPVEFKVDVDYGGSGSLVYSWDFGDGSSETTYEPKVIHTYAGLGNYSLKIGAKAGNLSNEKVFSVKAISPREAVDVSLKLKSDLLSSVEDSFSGFSFWYKDSLREILNLDFFSGEMEKLLEMRADAVGDDDFLEIAKVLYGLNIPTGLFFSEDSGDYFLTDLGDIHPEVVEAASGESVENLGDYREPILNWQTQNVDVSFSREEVFASWWDGSSGVVVSSYGFDVFSYENGESYFVIDKPIGELVFRKDVGADPTGQKSGEASGSTVIVLKEGERKEFDFYYEGALDDVSFFVSPRLSTIVVGANIDAGCNFNLVCEKGEDYKSCRSDCKPVVKAIVYGIAGLVVVLIVYTLLVFWYKRRYENYLFGDRGQLYNLMMYIANAHARGFEYSRIAADLRRQGWSSERVRYAIRKARGKRTGMIEIVPVSLIVAWIFKRRVRKIARERNVGGFG